LDLIIPPEMRRDVRQAIREMAETGQPIPASELLLMRKDGSRVAVFSSHTIIHLPGQPQELFCIDIDLTERKQAEEQKVKLEGQLQQALKMESVGRLAGGVAHDFNNMLGVILGHAEMAMEQVDPAQPIHADLTEILKAAGRSAGLTRQLLAFARKQTVAPRVLDLNKTISGMLKMLQRLIGEDIYLNWNPDADLWPVKVDPSQIDQILANLCVNARDAISGLGKLTIETKNSAFDEDYCATHAGFVSGEYVRLAISDNGCGMDKETLSHLYEPFFTTKEPGKGTGLGLATVYGIVKQNNGFINVYSEPGQGTTFTICLPRHAGKVEQLRTEGAPKSVDRGHETILLAEDEPALLELTTMLLKQQGYTVLAASTPGEAIRLAREHSGEINLLMTDVIMPEMNGRDLAKNLLALYPHMKRLFTSGYTADVIANHGVLDEGVHFMQKPFSRKDLATKVREALDQK
jgi:two-component system, cell cycle sensor histidine kinase and response regulator CckA